MDPFLGEIRLFAGTFAPKGWAFCNGQILAINQNQALFSLLGTFYGGNGITTFALPDLRGKLPVHWSSTIPIGTQGGEEQHTLIQNEMPAHNHTVGATSTGGTAYNPAGHTQAASTSRDNIYTAGGANGAMNPASVTAAGSSQPHENRQPYTVLNFIIALQGIYPSRS
ncbi:MAG TPA: tail fiber protein [Chloroflexia bacterium]|nr:tail fiber protein [Chloroflexia bacterium]